MQANNFQDLVGQRFGKLTVIGREENSKHGNARWLCLCDCGNKKIIAAGNLRSGHTQSCGCYRKELSIMRSTKHGKTHTRIYRAWQDMKNRCYNPKTDTYRTHGARGITVCPEWLNDFQAFYGWAISNGYSDNLTLDRVDTNGNYEPSNCRWATPKEQSNNKRNNHYITYNGRKQTLQQWADETGIKQGTIGARLKRGWSIEKALGTGVIRK